MPCFTIYNNGKPIGIACVRGHRRKPCVYCGRPGARLCDYPVKRKSGDGTCDRALCERCTSRNGEIDYCRPHAQMAVSLLKGGESSDAS